MQKLHVGKDCLQRYTSERNTTIILNILAWMEKKFMFAKYL